MDVPLLPGRAIHKYVGTLTSGLGKDEGRGLRAIRESARQVW
ncbi:hypothetical protein [Thermogemmatispora sp.]